jgi:hypothetical protein
MDLSLFPPDRQAANNLPGLERHRLISNRKHASGRREVDAGPIPEERLRLDWFPAPSGEIGHLQAEKHNRGTMVSKTETAFPFCAIAVNKAARNTAVFVRGIGEPESFQRVATCAIPTTARHLLRRVGQTAVPGEWMVRPPVKASIDSSELARSRQMSRGSQITGASCKKRRCGADARAVPFVVAGRRTITHQFTPRRRLCRSAKPGPFAKKEPD